MEIIAELPKTVTGKILRRELRRTSLQPSAIDQRNSAAVCPGQALNEQERLRDRPRAG